MAGSGNSAALHSNIFLHYVLDVWFEEEVKPRLAGHAFPIRFADNFAIGFRHERDTRRVMEVLPKRSGKYGLTIHPDKTRLIDFVSPSKSTAMLRRIPTMVRAPLACWALPTTGESLAEVLGWSIAKPLRAVLVEPCGASLSGVAITNTDPSASST